jgi:hypothetical protein
MLGSELKFGAIYPGKYDEIAAPRSGPSLLRHLTTQLATGVQRGVDVRVPFSSQQIRYLAFGQRRGALDRALNSLERKHDASVLARLHRAMEMSPQRRPRQAGVGDL